jgi:hypothetical protein
MVPEGAVDGSDTESGCAGWPAAGAAARSATAHGPPSGAAEVAVAVLVLSRDRRVRLGLLAAVAFMLGLAPLMAWYELANVPLVALALLLPGRDYDRSLWDLVRR